MKPKNTPIRRGILCSIQGYATAYALIAASVTIVLLTGLMIFATSNQRQSQDESSRQQAVHAAESGIYYYNWYLAHNLNGRTPDQLNHFWESENPLGVGEPFEQDVKDFEDQGIGKYRVEVTPPQAGSTSVVVKSTGWTEKHPNIKRTIQVRFRRRAWSEYAILSNDMMRFGAGTEVYGEMHANNGIQFDGKAHNLITSSVSSYTDPKTGQVKPGVWTSQSDPNEVFLAGKKYPVPMEDFNKVTLDFSYLKTQSQSNGIYLGEQYYNKTVCEWVKNQQKCGCSQCWCQVCTTTQHLVEGYHLTLRTDDKVEIRRVLDYGGDTIHEPNTYKIKEETEPEIRSFPASGLIFVENHVWVDGQINTAHLTIASANLDPAINTDIYINDDILYTNKDGQDTLGLVAENNISIGLYSQNDLEIDAALLAQNGRVGRDPYKTNNDKDTNGNSLNKRDKITIWGAIASNQRYGFNSDDGFGYSLGNIHFDNNLLYQPPPFFPTGTDYLLDLWEEL